MCNLLNIGYGSYLVTERIISILSPGSSPIKRLREEAKAQGLLIDSTYGRKLRSIIITDSKYVILCSTDTQTLSKRINSKNNDRQF